jgi:hypothetical protein
MQATGRPIHTKANTAVCFTVNTHLSAIAAVLTDPRRQHGHAVRKRPP